ncbi:MAG TPA: SlyX family protein [Polyangiaceae bacterium]|nr:SlyX family protein [Polyangiaceae bacterium]
MDTRLIDLEIRYTHLERQVQELSEVVFAQQRALDSLSKELVNLRSRQEDPGTPPAEKPPHY